MKIWDQLVRVSGTAYFLALMLICAFVLIYSDRNKFKKKGLKKESRFAFVSGIIYGIAGIILFALGRL